MGKYDELVGRLQCHATDWNGQQMPDAEPAKGDPTAGDLRKAATAIATLESEVRKQAMDYLVLSGQADEALARVAALEAELAAMKARGDRLAEALSKGGFMMTETHRLEGHAGARKLIIGFENGEHADDAMAAIRQALTEWRGQ